MMAATGDEREPLLQAQRSENESSGTGHEIQFEKDDPENPQNWPSAIKYGIVAQLSMIAFFMPMASSIYAPATDVIMEDFSTSNLLVLLSQSGFVCMLGLTPLFLAPMSDTFGRRPIYLICLIGFSLLQIPIALAPNIASFVVLRTLSGAFGSVGVGNGGGSITDMFSTENKAIALGVYMVFPLLAPTVGPLVGGIMVGRLEWRWLSWLNLILASVTLIICYFYLYETRAITLLQQRQKELLRKYPDDNFWVDGASDQSVISKIASNSNRSVRILATQPIVMVMSIYQALIFSTMYSLYAKYTAIWSEAPYHFDKTQVGLSYLAPALGFVVTAVFIVSFIDRLHDHMAKRNNDGEGRPEYRLPMANIGAVLLPVSLFWFGWTVEKQSTWFIPLVAMILFGASQVSIFNTVQTYYIDAYTSNAASALAAGAFLRSIVGAIVPLFIGDMFDKLGYGLGMSIFGGVAALLTPAPALFYFYGRQLRERFPLKL